MCVEGNLHMNLQLRPTLLAAFAGLLTACAQTSLPLNNYYPVQGQAPNRLQALNAQTNSQVTIQTHFVSAYQRSAQANEATARRDPNGPAAALLRLIQNAKQSLDGSFYDIDAPEVVDALIKAKQRGVQVRIVTDTDNMTTKESGPTGPARPAIVALKNAKIPVVDDQRSGIMHNKFLIVDGHTIWTGSTNLTTTSLYQHNNNALTIQSQQLAANYQSEFERLFTHRIFGPNPPRQVPYPVIKSGNMTIETYFSPKGGGQQAFLQELRNARQSISFMTFSLTDPTAGQIITAKQKQGIKVSGVFDRWLGAGQYSLFNPMKESGIAVRKDGNQALLHHKVILVDNTVITGSYNYSANAENSNNENFLVIKNAPAVTRAYQQEYNKVLQASQAW